MKAKIIISILLGMLCMNCIAQNVKVLEPKEFKMALKKDKNAVLLDVRKPDEFAEGHLKKARLMNWLDAEPFKQEVATLEKGKTIYVYCRSGRRSREAANYLSTQGFNVIDLKGGFMAWVEAGLPVSQSRRFAL